MSFFQEPPRLGNQYDDDALLRGYLERVLPGDLRASLEGEFRELGELAGGHYYEFQLRDRLNEPVLTQWDPWGQRVDHIEVSPLWKEAEALAARRGLVAVAYEQKNGDRSRLHQFALNYLVQPSLDVYSCPLAMTDGAARTLLVAGQPRADRARPAPPDVARPADVLDVGPVDDGAHGRLGRGADGDGGARVARGLAAVRDEVVHLGDDGADGADAGAARGQRRGRAGLALFYRGDAGRGRAAAAASTSTG